LRPTTSRHEADVFQNRKLLKFRFLIEFDWPNISVVITMIDDTDEDKMKEVEEILSLGSKDEEKGNTNPAHLKKAIFHNTSTNSLSTNLLTKKPWNLFWKE
jgi:hypothetical protein